MALPQNFETIMSPLMEAVSDGENHKMNDVTESLTNYFKLTEEERNLKYPTGSAYIFQNRARFARLYLMKAGLLESPERGFVKLSKNGSELMAKSPNK